LANSYAKPLGERRLLARPTLTPRESNRRRYSSTTDLSAMTISSPRRAYSENQIVPFPALKAEY